MIAMHGSVNMIDNEDFIVENEHEFESFAQEFVEPIMLIVYGFSPGVRKMPHLRMLQVALY